MRTFIGMGSGNAQSAVAQATQGLNAPSFIIFLADYSILEECARLLKDKYPSIQCIGTHGASHICNGKASDKGLYLCALFDDISAKAGIIEGLSECPISYHEEIVSNIRSVSPGRENTVCLEFSTNNEEMLTTSLYSCLSPNNVPLVGGTTMNAPKGKPSLVVCNDKAYSNACAYAIIRNKSGLVRAYKENIYFRKEGTKQHIATSVDTSRRALITLDNQNVVDVYSKEIGIPKGEIMDNVFKYSLGRVIGDNVSVAAIANVLPNGGICAFKQINLTDCIYFLTLGDYAKIEKDMKDTIRQDAKSISFIFSIDCIYRQLLYNKEGYFDTYIKDMAALGNHLGMVSAGEQFMGQHVNQTMLCAVFE